MSAVVGNKDRCHERSLVDVVYSAMRRPNRGRTHVNIALGGRNILEGSYTAVLRNRIGSREEGICMNLLMKVGCSARYGKES